MKRDEQKRKNDEIRRNKQIKEENNTKQSIKGDVDFQMLIENLRKKIYLVNPQPHIFSQHFKISINVRKRPIFPKELFNAEIDCVSVTNPKIQVHECKFKVDGISKHLENHEFIFDNSFGENDSTENVYIYTFKPLIHKLFSKGIITCFAYGQTGSGKTYTMEHIEKAAILDIFNYSNSKYK